MATIRPPADAGKRGIQPSAERPAVIRPPMESACPDYRRLIQECADGCGCCGYGDEGCERRLSRCVFVSNAIEFALVVVAPVVVIAAIFVSLR